MHKQIAAIALAATAALGVITTATPAAAAEYEWDLAKDATLTDRDRDCFFVLGLVEGCVQPYGDFLWLQDERTDGHGVYMEWTDLDSTREGTCTNNLGEAKNWTGCNKDFTEGHLIEWRLGYTASDGAWRLTDWRQTRI